MNSKQRILIVEDERRLAEIIQTGFIEQGFDADIAFDGHEGKVMTTANKYNLIILDINIPIINGYELCREIRSSGSSVPIIMLTALSESENKLEGFDSGADDYVVKPFDFKELLARVKVFLRRSAPDESVEDNMIELDDLIINTSKKTVFRSGKQIELTSKEYQLLEYMANNKGNILSRGDIAKRIWNLNFDTGTNYIDVYINYLRKKIDKDHKNKLIHTKVGFGYMIKNQNEKE